jgi:hypothetical protein
MLLGVQNSTSQMIGDQQENKLVILQIPSIFQFSMGYGICHGFVSIFHLQLHLFSYKVKSVREIIRIDLIKYCTEIY